MRMAHATVAVFGAAGYSGLELVKLLAAHPGARIACAASDTRAGRPVDEMTGTRTGLAFVRTEDALQTPADVALLAVPPEPAVELAAALRARGTKVIDLSNAHRASAEAVYGLTSLFPAEIAASPLVANPGCYATCVITAVAPLVREGLIERDVIVAAGSGVTGAGRSSDEAMSFGEHFGDVRAYKVLRHQHVPEIEATLARLGVGPRVILTTHLLPVARGIFATITVRLRTPLTSEALTARLGAGYADDPTVTIVPAPEAVSLRRVVGTNQCMVGVAARGDVAVITAALDNLLKGAAGQAVENLNLVLGLPRTAGLTMLSRHV
jgi:N-acetyl-gamma-glutamyl-phosphate reductase